MMRKLQTITSWVLVVLGCTMLSTFAIVRWTEQQVLNTNNWVATMSELPKNEAVARSIGVKVVDGIFEKADLTQSLQEVLPEKVAFLAPTISGFLRTRANDLATKIIMSNKFDQLWSDANRTAHENLVKVLRAPAREQKDIQVLPYKINLAKAQTWLQNAAANSENAQLLKAQDTAKDVVAFNASLRRGIDGMRAFVRAADSLYVLLPYATLAAFLGALALAATRRRILFGIGVGITALNALAIAGVNILRPALLNSLQEQAYKPIFDVLWTQLSQPFLSYARYLVMLGFVLIGLALALRHKLFTRALPSAVAKAGWYNKLTAGMHKAQRLVTANAHYLYGGGAAIATLVVAFGGFESWQPIVRVVLLYVTYASVVCLIMRPSLRTPVAGKTA
jgi:hypothetical protein